MQEIIICENFSIDEAAEYREKIYKLIGEGVIKYSLDFSKCNFIDSTGLGVLVAIYKKIAELGGVLELHSINNQQVMKIFKLTRLDKVFTIK